MFVSYTSVFIHHGQQPVCHYSSGPASHRLTKLICHFLMGPILSPSFCVYQNNLFGEMTIGKRNQLLACQQYFQALFWAFAFSQQEPFYLVCCFFLCITAEMSSFQDFHFMTPPHFKEALFSTLTAVLTSYAVLQNSSKLEKLVVITSFT